MKLFTITFLSLLINSLLLFGQFEKDLIAPLEIPFSISGTFGEPRSSHFHLGIDIKTQGKEGLEVKSISSGSVSRIRISLGGYGKAIYIDHPNKTTSVYAHLKKFAPKIESYIKKFQYENETYTIQKFPKKNQLLIEKGEVIGFSGNTGGSSGPHLHFEIREKNSQKPLNPLLYNLPVNDLVRPQLQKLFIFYSQENAILNRIQPILLKRVNDSLYKTAMIETSGKIGIGIQMFDRQDYSYSRNGVYSTKVFVNGKIISHYKFDKLIINESKKLYQVIDYKNYTQKRLKIFKLFYKSGNKLNFMNTLVDQGIFKVELGKSYQIIIEIEDFSGNKSTIEAFIEGTENKIKPVELRGRLIKTDREYSFTLKNKELFFPSKTFFNDVKIELFENKDQIEIGPNLFPIANSFEIKFGFNEKDSLRSAQTFIAKKMKKSLVYLPTKLEENKLIAKVNELGVYTLARDSVAPTVVPDNFKKNQWLSNYKSLNLKIDDDFSGIKKYRGTINGEWVLFEYEPKRKILTYDFFDKYSEKLKHNLELEVEDNVGNKKIYKTTFFRKYDYKNEN
ncbi:MAG: M23 family metallopeptidase [Bacteroidota bacterium]|nr:M23 family metallopeptidase [Bacteroidota bacterium]